MSAKDSQFIDQALAHPWMFWVYFWKWPRIVRQACAEYALLAKERDAAKEAHEQAVRANKIVRDWIHVTHRLDMTADMRAIWTAGKRLSALLLFLALTLSANAQLPPILRNQWTTNANPLALKVISTNGVHAATNVWELDFTNTATVTVSAVSNANKVTVSFDGSASGQPPSANLTNWSNLPTNGVFIEKTNGLGIRTTFQEWISVTNTASSVAKITNGGFTGASFLSSSPGSHARANAGGIAAGTFDQATNCFPWSFWGGHANAFFERCSNVYILGQLGGRSGAYAVDSRDISIDSTEGGVAGAWFEESANCSMQVRGGGLSGIGFHQNTNCTVFVDIGLGFGYFLEGTNQSLTARQGGIAVGSATPNGRLYASESAMSVGRNIVSTNSWTLGHHYTNDQDFSFAIGFAGVKQFGVASNGLMTIENIDYNWPNAHAVGFLTNNGSGGLGWSASGGSGGGEATTNGTLQPFDVSKTWIVFMGDSITAGGAGVTAYPERVTNLTHWRTPAFFTNQAVGGTTFHIQTNVFWTNTLPLLPAVATNGTNVIISIQAGINDFNSGSNFLAMQASHQVFSDALHARGYIVVRTTMMPFEPNNDLTFSNIFRFNNWVRSASNYFDRVADFARRLPNSYDLDFWYVDRIHPTNSGQFELTKEWDTAVRFNTLPQPDRFDKWQRTWQVHDSDGLMRVSIGSEFYGSNDISGIFFNGDNLSGNQTGIYITNNASPADMIYNVINQGNHVFREGNVEILRFGEQGLSTPMVTLTGTGTASSGATGLVFDNPGGTGNDVGIWRDSADSRGIFYHSGIGANVGFHKFTISDTVYLTLDIPGGSVRFQSLAASNVFSGKVAITNNFKALAGVAFSRFATNANVTMTPDFYVWAITSVAVLVTNTLPSASTCAGTHFIIKDEGGNASATNITIAVQSGDRIDGASTATINVNYGAKNAYSAGSTNWFIF